MNNPKPLTNNLKPGTNTPEPVNENDEVAEDAKTQPTDPVSTPTDDAATDSDQAIITEIEPGVYTRTSAKSKYIVEYRKDVCIGAASCSAIAPNTFIMNDENKAEMISTATQDDDDVIMAAAQSCPVFAIIVRDKETGEQLFPIE